MWGDDLDERRSTGSFICFLDGAGVSWKTPWKGKVSVGAESLLSQGRNSLNMDNTASAPITDQRIDGVRPYVRVEIDL